MITTSEIAPSLALAPFVRCYSYIEFDTKGLDFVRPTNASHEIVMTFHFEGKPARYVNGKLVQSFEKSYGGAMGLFTQSIGDIIFNGHYIFFEIMFRPTGFNRLFGLPPQEMNNKMIFADDIFEPGIKFFYEQLCNARDLNDMCILTDSYLFSFLNRQKTINHKDALACISNGILKKRGVVNIDKLAYDANMSIRTFERHFTNQIGISPKLFCNIIRFNDALALKLKKPQMNWTSVALTSGYYDQMHLIKDFKKFAGCTPANFHKETHLTKVNYTSRIDT